MKPVLLLSLTLLCLPLSACFETYTVSKDGLKGVRWGTDTAAVNFKGDGWSFQQLKNNNSKSFKAGAGVANMAIGAYGMLGSAKEVTAQRASDNALKANQAGEATRQVEIINNGTKFLPAEGEAISRPIQDGASVFIP